MVGLLLVLGGLLLGLGDLFPGVHGHEHGESGAPVEKAYPLGVVDFGAIENGEEAERTLFIRNHSEASWRVERTWVSCGCLAIQVVDPEVGAGEDLRIKAALRPTRSPPGTLLQSYSLKLTGSNEILSGAVRASIVPAPSVSPNYLAVQAKHDSGDFSGRFRLILPEEPDSLALDADSITAGLFLAPIATRILATHVEYEVDLEGSLAPGVGGLQRRVELSAMVLGKPTEPRLAVELVVTRAPAGVVFPSVLLIDCENPGAEEQVISFFVRGSSGLPPPTIRVIDAGGRDLGASYDPWTGRATVPVPYSPGPWNRTEPGTSCADSLRVELNGSEKAVEVPLFQLQQGTRQE